ncbi:MAG: ABC transporter substrate-binding protein [Anaerolineaceae bacterium]|nr:ABC transporter substrate-binding protein [Anaerolineaceae bacterium]
MQTDHNLRRITQIPGKNSFFLLFFIFIIFILSACSPSQKPENTESELIVVGFSQVGSESDWRKANTISMEDAFSVENGYRLIFDDAQQKQEKQITAIRNFINQGVDYIVLAPITMEGWDTVLNEAKAAGIPVIIVDRMVDTNDPDLFTCWVGSDTRREGDIAVKWMEKNLKGPLNIVHLQGNIGSSAQAGRTEGLQAGLDANPDWKLVFQAPGDFVQAKGQELMEEVLSEGIGFNVIYAENDNMAYGVIDALKAHDIIPGKDVTVISFDAAHDALKLVLSGELNLDVECNPLHGPRVRSLIEQLERGETSQKYTYVEEVYFDAENLTEAIIAERIY